MAWRKCSKTVQNMVITWCQVAFHNSGCPAHCTGVSAELSGPTPLQQEVTPSAFCCFTHNITVICVLSCVCLTGYCSWLFISHAPASQTHSVVSSGVLTKHFILTSRHQRRNFPNVIKKTVMVISLFSCIL